MKKIFKILLFQIGFRGLFKYIFLGIASGLFSFLFINLITRVVNLLMEGELKTINKEYVIIFAFVILFFIWSRRILSFLIIHLSQNIFWQLRKEVLGIILKANYQKLSASRNKIYTTMVHDINILTNSSVIIIDFSTSLIIAVSTLIYMSMISFTLFLITIGISLAGVVVYQIGANKSGRAFEKARDLENDFMENFNAIIDGFKEIYMEPKKGKFIYEKNIKPLANNAYKNNIKAYSSFLNNQITGQILFYILISSVLLVFSVILKIKSGDTVSFVFVLIYLLAAIEHIMVLLPEFVRAKISVERIIELKKDIESPDFSDSVPDEKTELTGEFHQLAIRNLKYSYGETETSFGVGPVNLEINRGDIVFIYGGNGSGKTTVMKSILGLYKIMEGEIRLNDIRIDESNYNDYRARFSVVFSDFYLFREIVLPEIFDEAKWAFYIGLFELEGKIKLEGTKFSTTELSTGQRKRLALVMSLLENKEILVLDEWAADQDPYFRKKFYTEILPLLKSKGITIIAITHDDRYYHCADRLFKMEYGTLNREEAKELIPTHSSTY
ncbi:MAG: hypothetical protein JWO09_9 [Bacteroidetes bacterium]|nr:hypothetical protein [Bacteroidota bacterium]